jgi:hypothetical protein
MAIVASDRVLYNTDNYLLIAGLNLKDHTEIRKSERQKININQ